MDGKRKGNAEREEGIAIRKALKAYIAARLPEIEGRVDDFPGLKDSDLSGMGVGVMLGEEIWKSAWAGYRTIIKIWPHAAAGSDGFQAIDLLAGRLVELLNETVIGTERSNTEPNDGFGFTCFYLGSTDPDQVEPVTGRLTRGLKFAAYRQPKETAAEAGAALHALSTWTRGIVGGNWAIHLDHWPTDCAAPCVLWRLSGSRSLNSAAEPFDVRRTYTGHVMARSAREEREVVQRIVDFLSIQNRIGYEESGHRVLAIAEAEANLQSDRFLKGQITLNVTERIRKQGETAALIGRVGVKTSVN